jgi:hypothetical protein
MATRSSPLATLRPWSEMTTAAVAFVREGDRANAISADPELRAARTAQSIDVWMLPN